MRSRSFATATVRLVRYLAFAEVKAKASVSHQPRRSWKYEQAWKDQHIDAISKHLILGADGLNGYEMHKVGG